MQMSNKEPPNPPGHWSKDYLTFSQGSSTHTHPSQAAWVLVHWNIGSAKTIKNSLSSFFSNLPDNTAVIAINEAKVNVNSKFWSNLRLAAEKRFNTEFSIYVNAFTNKDLQVLDATEAQLNHPQDTTSAQEHRKKSLRGGQALLVRKALEVKGQPFAHSKVIRHESKRILALVCEAGINVVNYYAQAGAGSKAQEASGTYLDSPARFNTKHLAKCLSENTIILGDNLYASSADDSGAKAGAKALSALLQQHSLRDAFEECCPEGENIPSTYSSGPLVKTRPDRIYVPERLLDNNAVITVAVDENTYSPNTQFHKPIIIEIDFAHARRPMQLAESRKLVPNPSAEHFIQAFVQRGQALIDPLEETIKQTEMHQHTCWRDMAYHDRPAKVLEDLVKALTDHAKTLQAVELKEPPPQGNKLSQAERKSLHRLHHLNKTINHVKEALRAFKESPVPDITRNHIKRKNWKLLCRNAKKAILESPTHPSPAENIITAPMSLMPNSIPNQEAQANLQTWLQLAMKSSKELTLQQLQKQDFNDLHNAELELEEWQAEASLDTGRWLQKMRNRAAAMNNRPPRNSFSVGPPPSVSDLEAQPDANKARAEAAATFWKGIHGRRTEADKIKVPQLFDKADKKKFLSHAKSTKNRAFTAQEETNRKEEAKNLTRHIPIEELSEAVKQIPNNKAVPTHESTPNELWKFIFRHSQIQEEEVLLQRTRSALAYLLNAIFKGAAHPDSWDLAEIVCLYKSGDREDPGNYRPIALLPSLGKIYTSILQTRLQTFCESFSLLSSLQRGSRPFMSTYQLVTTLIATISHARARREHPSPLYVLFLDIKKAYNSVPFAAIEKALQHLGVPEDFSKAVMAHYENPQSRIRMGDVFSHLFEEERGVRQGDPLSPLLWIIFLNPLLSILEEEKLGYHAKTANCAQSPKLSQQTPFDVPDIIEAVSTALTYVDDIAFTAGSWEKLERGAKIITEFLNFYGIEVGIKPDGSKTALMAVTPEPGTDGKQILLQGQVVPRVSEYKYLGVTVSNDLDPTKDFEQTKKSLSQAANILKVAGRLSTKQISWLCNAVIWPIAQYRTRLQPYTKKQCEDLNKVVRKAVRAALGCFDFPNAMIHGDSTHPIQPLGILDLTIQQDADYLSSMAKLILSDRNPAHEWLTLLAHEQAWRLANFRATLVVNQNFTAEELLNNSYIGSLDFIPANRNESKIMHTQWAAIQRACNSLGLSLVETTDALHSVVWEEAANLKILAENARIFWRINAHPAALVTPHNPAERALIAHTGFTGPSASLMGPAFKPAQNLWFQQNLWIAPNYHIHVLAPQAQVHEQFFSAALLSPNLGAPCNSLAEVYGTKPSKTAAALQALEAALLLTPRLYADHTSNQRVRSATIWMDPCILDVLPKLQSSIAFEPGPWAATLRRCSLALLALRSSMKVTLEPFSQGAVTCANSLSPQAQTAMIETWNQFSEGKFPTIAIVKKELNTVPLIQCDRFILILNEARAHIRPHSKISRSSCRSHKHTMANLLTLLPRAITGNVSSVVRKNTAPLYEKKYALFLAERAQRLDLPDASALGTLYVPPSSKDHRSAVQEGNSIAQLKLRTDRSTNSWRARRPENAIVHDLSIPEASTLAQAIHTIRDKAASQPTPHQSRTVLTAAMACTDHKAKASAARKRINQLKAHVDATIIEEAQTRVAAQPKTEHFQIQMRAQATIHTFHAKFKRHSQFISPMCNRCMDKEETLTHLLRDCTHSQELLSDLQDKIDHLLRHDTQNRFGWYNLWPEPPPSGRELNDLPLGTIKHNMDRLYHILLGYMPLHLKRAKPYLIKETSLEDIARDIAFMVQLTTQKIFQDKRRADYHRFITLWYTHIKEQGEVVHGNPPNPPTDIFPAEVAQDDGALL